MCCPCLASEFSSQLNSPYDVVLLCVLSLAINFMYGLFFWGARPLSEKLPLQLEIAEWCLLVFALQHRDSHLDVQTGPDV